MAKAKNYRPYASDDQLCMRIPAEDKAKIWELAREKRRSGSSMVLEWISEGIRRAKEEMRKAACHPGE